MELQSKPHALVLPFPAQGHVIPLLELAYCMVDRGFMVTFVNTEFNHDRVITAIGGAGSDIGHIRLVFIPDGLGPGEDRNDLALLTQRFLKAMPQYLEDLITKSTSNDNKITCMIADQTMAWALNIAKKTGIRSATFFPASSALLAISQSIPKLIEDGIIDEDGAPKREMVELIVGMPPVNPAHLSWNCFDNPETRRIIFSYVCLIGRATEIAEFIICNSFLELELPAFTYCPNMIPIGPLLTGHRRDKLVGYFWTEDVTCSGWLDQQPDKSVIYVAFGSFTVFDQRQFQEIALGLELTGRPFLWVVRPDLTGGAVDAFPIGFRERVANRGKMVGWSPQQKVLAHPAIACFVSHCGWNSTLEGVRNGVPFLCWPYFVDQFLNQSYICDAWRIGLKMSKNESGIYAKEQIKQRLEELLGDEGIKSRAMGLKEMAERNIMKEGTSFKNLNKFVDAMK